MKLLYEIISLFNHDYMLKLSLKINDGYLVNNHLFQNLEKKRKNKKTKKTKKGYKDLRRTYSGPKAHPRAELGSGIAQRYNI